LDFLGVQYYTRPLAGRNGLKIVDSIANKNKHNPHGWMVDGMHYRFDPQGILPVLTEVSSRIEKPLLVTEIGTAGTDNNRKEQYYKIAIKAMRAAQDRGIRLIGALFWTLFPNLEWQHGYDPNTNFGILDSNSNEKTPGFYFLQQANLKTFYQQLVGAAP
jgi:beta-glucosidase/6-phospho-beta-glucosidase/beta-galactosidase